MLLPVKKREFCLTLLSFLDVLPFCSGLRDHPLDFEYEP